MKTQKHPFIAVFSWLLLVFLVLFPKGGFRAGILPLTWGYMFLIVAAVPALLVRLLMMPLRYPPRVLAVMFLLTPMLGLFIYAGVFYGVETVPFAFSTFVGLFGLPFIFLLVFSPFYPLMDARVFQRTFCFCIFAAAVWGLLMFFYHPVTNHYIEIPYLTVNASDFGELEGTKHNQRGLFQKLISTYNNGNIYGVATLMLLPLYQRLEKKAWKRNTVLAALFLSLSRTVWVGLAVNEGLTLIVQIVAQWRTLPVVYLRRARRSLMLIAVVMSLSGLFALYITLQGFTGFLFDLTAGGRLEQLFSALDTTFLPSHALYGFGEVLYASAAQYWGWSGLMAFCLIMFSPFLVLAVRPEDVRDPIKRAALKGLVIYMVMGASDGALDYIPVMAFYWFVYSVYLCGWPGTQRLPVQADRKPAALRSAGTAAMIPLPEGQP